MKLFLSSTRLPSNNERIRLFGDKPYVSVVIIPNAWDRYPESRQQAAVANTVSDFTRLDYTVTMLDLVTSSKKQQEDAVVSSDLVWMMGGNSFYLNYIVQKTGFNALINQALDQGVVYGGTSAGAIIATPTLRGVENADDPSDALEVIWDGLSLVEFGIVPHWGTEKYADALEKVADEMRQYVPQIVTLTNEQAVTVIDGEMEIV